MQVAGIVLAAGRSTRMGRNKLLVELGGESLVRRAARAALEAGLDPVLVVVGHEAERVAAGLAGLRCAAVPSPRHARGLNASLDAGVAAVPDACAAAVVVLGDMPLVGAATVSALLARHAATGAPVVASRYGGVPAPPVLYARAVLPELRGGEGDGRGREVLSRHAGEVAWVDWPAEALADVDDPSDLAAARGAASGERP